MKKNKKILSLEGIRGIAFVAVMLTHTGMNCPLFKGAGSWAVSVFFMISGFVALVTQYKTTTIPSVKNNILYTVKRISKTYPIYLLCLIVMLLFDFIGSVTKQTTIVFLRLFLNIFLIQEWIPLIDRSIVGTSWFLCTIFLSGFVFPWILEKMQKDYSLEKAEKNILFLFFFQILIVMIGHFIPKTFLQNKNIISNIPDWFVYNFPPSRLIDVLIGNNVGYIYIANGNKKVKNATQKEMFVVLFSIIAIIIHGSFLNNHNLIVNTFLPPTNNILSLYAVLYTPICSTLVLLFSYEQGKISKLIANRATLHLAKLSRSGFLISDVVNRYLLAIILFVVGKENEMIFRNYYMKYIYLVVGIPLSLACCQIWISITNRIKSKKHIEVQ